MGFVAVSAVQYDAHPIHLHIIEYFLRVRCNVTTSQITSASYATSVRTWRPLSCFQLTVVDEKPMSNEMVSAPFTEADAYVLHPADI